MNQNTQELHNLGQRIWIDSLNREALRDGSLRRLIDEFSVTGLTSNPTIFERALAHGSLYDREIAELKQVGLGPEEVFLKLEIEDLQAAADLFARVHEASHGADGWVSLEVSPLLRHDTAGTIQEVQRLHDLVDRRNAFIKIPGTPAGLPAIEECVYRGIPVNVTLLFSPKQYLATSEAYIRGIERRLNEEKSPAVPSVASLFVSRWDAAVHHLVPPWHQNRLGIAVAGCTYKAHRDLVTSDRWRRLADAGVLQQRLLFASTGTKDPAAHEAMYVQALVAAGTIDTMPEKTLQAFAEHGHVSGLLPVNGRAAQQVLDAFKDDLHIDVDALAVQLQEEGGRLFAASYTSLLAMIMI